MGGDPDTPSPTVKAGPSRAANFWYHVTEGALATFGGELVGRDFFQVMVLALGGTAATLGGLQSIAAFSFIAPLLLAPRVEAVRRKKRLVLLLGLGQRAPLLLTAGLLALLATRRPMACLYAIAVVQLAGGVANRLLVAPWQDLIAETVPIQRVGRLFGFRHFLSNLLRLPSAVLCAGIIATFAAPLNFELVHLMGFAVMMVSWGIFWRVRELPDSAAPRPRQAARHYFRDLLAAVRDDRNYRRYLLFAAINKPAFAVTGFLAFVAVAGHGLGKAEVVALAGVLSSGALIGGTLILPFVAERAGPKPVLAASVLLGVGALVVAALAPTGGVFMAAFFVLGLSAAAGTVAGPPFMMRVFPRGRRVGYIALAGVAVAPLSIVAPLAAGVAMKWFGHRIVFAVAAVVAVSALLPLARIGLADEARTGPGADA